MNEEMERPPWWLSRSDDDDTTGTTDPGSSSASGSGGFADMWSLLGTFGNVAGEWLTASGAGEHAEHGDPSEHPECMVCKVLVGVQAVAQPSNGPATATPLARTRWLSVRDA